MADVATAASWSALSAAAHVDDHELVRKHARALLVADPDDDLALQCLLMASLQLSDLDEAESVLEKHPAIAAETKFARAYLLYRLRRFPEAMQLLDSLPPDEERTQQLRALSAARLGQNQLSAQIYRKFLEQLHDDDDEHYRAELLANYLAVCSPSEAESALQRDYGLDPTITTLYNGACSKLADGDFSGAEAMLRRAADLCQRAGLSDDELVEELSPIQVQLAYTRQMQGHLNEARDLYQSVLEMVPAGAHTPAVAVASLNLMSLRHGDEKHFDSAKRLARALKVDQKKLTDYQIATIEKNQALLMLFEKQLDGCVQRCRELLEKNPKCSFVAILLACALCRQKKHEEAFEFLRTQRSLDTELALVQMLLEQKQNVPAYEALQSPVFDDLRFEPAFVSLMISLQDEDSAVKTLLNAAGKNAELAAYTGSYLLRAGKSEKAIDLLSAALKGREDNTTLLKSLITACFSAGREIPANISSLLPPVPSLSADQIAAYEQAAISTSKHLKKKSEVPDSSVVEAKKKKKKKKKIRYPKGFDPANPGPPPDPERWLPRYERTKGRRRNQMSMKGPQGALPTSVAGTQGSGRSRANRGVEDKNILDNQRQRIQAATSGNNQKAKKGKKRR